MQAHGLAEHRYRRTPFIAHARVDVPRLLDSHASIERHRDKLREACEAAKREIEITIEDAAASQLNGFAVTINSGPRLLLSEILSKLRAALAITAPSPPAETATP